MKIFLTQPRLQYFLLSSLTLSFFGGVTSQTVVLDAYAGPDPVVKDTQIKFTGKATSTKGSFPSGISFLIRYTNGQPDSSICDMDFSVCDDTLNLICYCSSVTDNTYRFVIQIDATLEKSNAFVIDDLDTTRVAFPAIIGTRTGSTGVTNDNVTFTTVTTGVGGDSVSPTVTVSTTPQIDTTDGPTTETTPDEDDNDDALKIGLGVGGGIVAGVICAGVGAVIYKKKKESASVTSDQPSDSPAEEASTVHSTNHNALTSSKPEDKVEMTGEKKKKKSKKSTKAGSPKKKKKDFENGEKKMDENEPRCLPQPEPVAEPGLSTSLSNPEALKSNFATTRLSSPPSNTRPTSIEMTSAPRPLPSPRNPNM